MNVFIHLLRKGFLLLTLFVISYNLHAQSLLNKPVIIQSSNEALGKILEKIEKQGGFYFSYNSNLFNKDSIVSIFMPNKTVKQVLDALFKGSLQYKETKGYIILQQAATSSQHISISGYVQDAVSREKLSGVSVYDPLHLSGTTTNDDGYFKLQLKNKAAALPSITISRVAYADTTIELNINSSQQVIILIVPSTADLETVVVSSKVQGTWLGKLVISSRLKEQSLNMMNFLAKKPFQFSLTPGIGTHGQLGSQVINRFSFNILGGYTAGTNGFELAGLFNINQQNAQHLQIAGIFNLVGKKMIGFQIAGIYNHVMDSVKGFQIGGITNMANNVKGMQLGGIVNVAKDIKGFQLGGIVNEAKNIDGMQLGGIVNKAKKVKGVQLAGIVNIADSSDYPVGVINLIKNGEKAIGLYVDESLTSTLAFRSGGRVLYGILGVAYNGKNSKSLVGMEAGLGAHLHLSDKFRFNTEAFALPLTEFKGGEYLRSGVRLLAGYKITPRFELVAGGSFNYTTYTRGLGNGLVDHYLWDKVKGDRFHGLHLGVIGGVQFVL